MNNVKKLTLTSDNIPESLRSIPTPPRKLFVMGNIEPLLARPRIAIVGSRKVSPYGRHVTELFAEVLAKRGGVIVSGLALGVDSIAHQACLRAGGQTIAVLPTSLENIYPASHRQLAVDIIKQGGALISEYPKGTPSLKKNFIERNRLVSGISDGVIITEAALKSGTLHTANFALEQGRTVMAVPGNITSSGSEGANNLLKAGAIMATDIEDVLLALHMEIVGQQRQLPLADNQQEKVILDLMAKGLSDGSELLEKSGLAPQVFNQTLTMLEISGKIHATGGGNWGIK